jgi:hypothetical protein
MSRAPLWLGLILLGVGMFVQAQYWYLMPLWYHLAFLLLLVPACMIGSRLRRARWPDPASLRDPA